MLLKSAYKILQMKASFVLEKWPGNSK